MRYKMQTWFFAIAIFILNICYGAFAQQAPYTEKTVIITNDGWQLHGDLILPAAAQSFSIVLLLNKANGNRQAYAQLAQQLAKRNIASLRLDLRGHGESINKGKFIPFDSLNNANMQLGETYKDVMAAYRYLQAIHGADTNKMACVGASYNGENMMIAARQLKYALCYVALSPGSFSDESISKIDSSGAAWLFVKSQDEMSMRDFEKYVFAASKKAEIIIVAGTAHATDILSVYPGISVQIADWLKAHL